MLIQTPHIIKQQYLDVEVIGSESDGITLQHRLPGLCEERLTAIIERTLDRCAPADGYLSIERLDIDVGTVPLERVEHDLAELVGKALEKRLRDFIPQEGQVSTIPTANIQYTTAHQAIHDAFLFFLTTGTLPWSFRLREGKNLEEVILDAWHHTEKTAAVFSLGKDAMYRVLGSEFARKRLIRQFSQIFLETFLLQISTEGKKVMDGILQVLLSSAVPLDAKRWFENQLWETAFALTAAGSTLSASALVGAVLDVLPRTMAQQPALVGVIGRHWPNLLPNEPAIEIEGPEQIPPNEMVHPSPSPLLSQSKSQSIHINQDIHQESQHLEMQNGLYIENAGVALLHPFLPQLFESLGIVFEGTMQNPDRALGLLHFLVTGQSKAPEYELVLPKILCNIPLETPVESDVRLTTQEMEEATGLLNAVIRHWEVLRDTSPDGLRATFLLRPGKVSKRDDGDWWLQVESNSVDILLDQLPWSLSMIKLPWMDNMLWVEWR